MAIAYDAQTLQIASIRATDAGWSTLQALVYAERDRVGNVLTLRDDATVGGPVTETYAYDSQYRVRRAVLAGGTVPGYAYAYAYALNGRLQRNRERVPGHGLRRDAPERAGGRVHVGRERQHARDARPGDARVGRP